MEEQIAHLGLIIQKMSEKRKYRKDFTFYSLEAISKNCFVGDLWNYARKVSEKTQRCD